MTPLSAWCLTTGRLRLAPVGHWDLADLMALKRDPRVFAVMLGGVRTAQQVRDELAADICCWGANGYGMWSVRALRGRFLGIVGLMDRPDGRGVALRFAVWPEVRGYGMASEAAFAALTYGHEVAALPCIIAVAREENYASRSVLGAIGMVESERFWRDGVELLVYKSSRG